MKRKISLLAVAAITAFSMNMYAQNVSTQECSSTGKCQKAEQLDKAKKCRPEKKDMDRRGKRGEIRPDSMAAFNGITLSDSQKQAISKIRSDFRAARKAKAQVRKEKNMEKRTPQMRDSLRNVAMQERLDYLHQIQKVLTPEQYITFLENTAVMKNVAPGSGFRMNKGGARGSKMDKGDRRGDKHDRKGPRARKDGRKAPAGAQSSQSESSAS